MGLIGRIARWTPPNLVVAFFAASFLSAYLVVLGSVLSAAPYDQWWDWLWSVLAMPVLAGLLGGWVFAAALAVFGVLPTWLLRRFHDRWWMWPLAIGLGGASSVLTMSAIRYWIDLFDYNEQPFGLVLLWKAAVPGLVCAVIWWILARRVLMRDAAG